VGNDGETLVADSSTSTGLRYQAIQTRNCVHNSSFEIWQRGTSFTTFGYTADRWYASTGGVAGRTISRVAGTGAFQYLLRIQRTAGNTATNGVDLSQSFEIADATPYAGKTVTVSFYARKGADFAGSFSLLVFSGTSSTETNRGTTAYPSGAATPLNTGVTLTTTLTRYQYTFTFGASVTQFAILPSMGFSGTAGAADYVDFTGFQLEVGSVATDYVRNGATFQGELAACQRYYQRITGNSGNPLAYGANSTTSVHRSYIYFPVEMRTAPTALEQSGTASDYGINQFSVGVTTCTALITFFESSNKSILVSNTLAAATLTTFQPGGIRANATGAYLGWSAEL
jgi:hypothetical protein